ncbi:hypothetical protein LguiA_024118 [Lonicera macranthoides]
MTIRRRGRSELEEESKRWTSNLLPPRLPPPLGLKLNTVESPCCIPHSQSINIYSDSRRLIYTESEFEEEEKEKEIYI